MCVNRFGDQKGDCVCEEKEMDSPHDENVCILPGGKYGVDYECYLGNPLVYHSMFLMEIVPYGLKWSLRMMMMRTRLAGLVKKTFVVCLETDTREEDKESKMKPDISSTEVETKDVRQHRHRVPWRLMTIVNIRSLSEIPFIHMSDLKRRLKA
jgi:hypothetical protein